MDKTKKDRLIRLYEKGQEAAHKMSMEEARAVAEKWQKLLAATGKKFSDSTELLREDRER